MEDDKWPGNAIKPEPATSEYLRGAKDLAERLKARLPDWNCTLPEDIDAALHEMIKEKE